MYCIAKALGQDPSQLALNKESVRQARRQRREAAAHMIKEAFDVDGQTGPLTVGLHWDGTIKPALTCILVGLLYVSIYIALLSA